MKFLSSYRLLIVLSVIVTLFSAELIIVGTVVGEIEKATNDLGKRLRKLRISETETLLNDLNEELAKHKIPHFDSEEARDWMINVLEEFRELYNAKIIRPVTKNGSSYSSEISFKYLPDNPDDLVRLMQYLRSSEAPVYNIKSVVFYKVPDARTVEIKMELVQPYLGGKYDY